MQAVRRIGGTLAAVWEPTATGVSPLREISRLAGSIKAAFSPLKRGDGDAAKNQPSFQPWRYSRRRNRSASGAFGMRIVFAFHSSFLPERYATLPRWFASVSGPL